MNGGVTLLQKRIITEGGTIEVYGKMSYYKGIPPKVVYGLCGSRNDGRIGRRATDVKNANAGPKLH